MAGEELDLFGLGNINDTLATIQQEAEQKAAAERRAAQVAVRESEGIQASAQQHNAAASRVQRQLDTLTQQRSKAQRLATSDNPMDRIRLVGEQILNPTGFTREGRQARAAELSQLLGVQSQIHNRRVSTANARIGTANARAAASATTAEGTLSKLRTRVSTLQAANQGMIATENLRMGHLERQTLGTLEEVRLAWPDDEGFITIGDFKYEQHEIDERYRNVRTRSLLSSLPVNAMTVPELRAHQALMVENMSLGELEEIQSNDYTFEGQPIERTIVDESLLQRRESEQTRLSQATQSIQARQQLEGQYARIQGRLDSLSSLHEPGSKMGEIVSDFNVQLASVAEAAEVLDSQGADKAQSRMTQLMMLRVAEDKLMERIDAQAATEAGGDENLIPIVRARLLGQSPNMRDVESYMTEQYAANRSMSGVFSEPVTREIQQLADTEFNNMMRSRDITQGEPSRTEKIDMRRVASRTAITQHLNQQASAALGQTIDIAGTWMTSESSAPSTSPRPRARPETSAIQLSTEGAEFTGGLRDKGIERGDFMAASTQAEGVAESQILAIFNLSEEELAQVARGEFAAAGVSASRAGEIAEAYNLNQLQALYDQLELLAPGAGESYVRFFTNNLERIGDTATRNLDTDAQLVKPFLQENLSATARALSEIDQTVTRRLQIVAEESLNRIRDPLRAFNVATELTHDLSQDQRQRLLNEVIRPAHTQAQQQGLNQQDTTDLILRSLEEGTKGNPSLESAAQRVLRQMPRVQETLQQAANDRLQEIHAEQNRVMSRIPPISGMGGFASDPSSGQTNGRGISGNDRNLLPPSSTRR